MWVVNKIRPFADLSQAVRLHGCALLVIALCSLPACERPPSESRPAQDFPSVRSRDLSQDEAEGGHVLRKHVGQTDDQLRERLREEPNITGASTYTDRATAEHAIGAAIAQNRSRIQQWLERPGRHANLVIDYTGDGPIGRTLNRGETAPRPCSHALIVLKYDPPGNYHVLTSYPECRP